MKTHLSEQFDELAQGIGAGLVRGDLTAGETFDALEQMSGIVRQFDLRLLALEGLLSDLSADLNQARKDG